MKSNSINLFCLIVLFSIQSSAVLAETCIRPAINAVDAKWLAEINAKLVDSKNFSSCVVIDESGMHPIDLPKLDTQGIAQYKSQNFTYLILAGAEVGMYKFVIAPIENGTENWDKKTSSTIDPNSQNVIHRASTNSPNMIECR